MQLWIAIKNTYTTLIIQKMNIVNAMLGKYLSRDNLEKIRNEKIFNFLHWDILELWCGEGRVCDYLYVREIENSYTGIDFEERNIKKLKAKYPQYAFLLHDLDEQVDLGDKKFDFVVSTAVIEHIYNQKNFILTATKNLKIGGKLILTTPSVFGNDVIYPLICKLGFRKWKWILSDHIVIYNKDRFEVIADNFNLKIIHFEYFELHCNQLIIYEKLP